MDELINDTGNAQVVELLPDDTKKKPGLKLGHCYFIKEHRLEIALDHLKNGVKDGAIGLCIIRDPPEKFKQKYNPPDCAFIWLSNLPHSDSTQPKNLENILMYLDRFMTKKEGTIILIDCIEFLITNHDFNTVLKLLQNIRDRIIINKAILIVSINPNAMTQQQINLLENQLKTM